MTGDIIVVPANGRAGRISRPSSARGDPSRRYCQRYKSRGREWDSDAVPVAERANRLRMQTRCGQPEADTTSGLVAYLDGEPVGWCAVELGTAYVRLGRNLLCHPRGLPAPWRQPCYSSSWAPHRTLPHDDALDSWENAAHQRQIVSGRGAHAL
jgi:hypothetical protein